MSRTLAVAGAVATCTIVAGIHNAFWVCIPGMLVMVAWAQIALERTRRERDGLRRAALTDPLTGLANRRRLRERIDYEIARHTRARRRFAVVLIDLDGFKALNDRFGHPTGDDLLRDVAAALKGAVRDQDTVARLGGDEFCILAPETDQGGSKGLAARAAEAIGTITAGIDTLAASTGSAVFPDDGIDPQALLRAADGRLLSIKRSRPHAYRRAA